MVKVQGVAQQDGRQRQIDGSLLSYAIPVRQDAVLAPATGQEAGIVPGATPPSLGQDMGPRPGAATGLDHPYIFLWIWEDNSHHAFKGFAARQGVTEAATYNTRTHALMIYEPETLTAQTRILVLTEASSGDTLLFSQIHAVSEPHWPYAIPDLEWWGIYRAGEQEGEVDI